MSKRGAKAMVRTRQNDDTARAMLTELLEQGRLNGCAVVLRYGRPLDQLEIFGHGLTPWMLSRVLIGALEQLSARVEQTIRPLREAHIEPDSIGEIVGTTKSEQGIKTGADGLVPPEGETIISCGVCHHPRYYVTINEADGLPARLSCAHCGNEIVLHRVFHREGQA